MTGYEDILKLDPFSVPQSEKEELLSRELSALTDYHREHCEAYRRMTDATGFSSGQVTSCADIPFLPVRLFKELDLRSVSEDEVFKTMTSSGTTGQRPSRIFLDKETAANQQKTLVKIAHSFLRVSRAPMVIIDSPSVLKDRTMFSVRGAGILGFSIFARQKIYALKDDMTLDMEGLQSFLEKNAGKRILLFGFTFMVWKYLYQALKEIGEKIDFGDSILVHGGGWKKLVESAVSPEEYRKALKEQCGIAEVSNYYGMVEQTGCVYMECKCGHLHASTYSDVILRHGHDFSEAGVGEHGILQVVSLLPKSYPGHSLLTEDEGVLLGIDDCPCGRKGKYFKVIGRLAHAELRGCSDTYAAMG